MSHYIGKSSWTPNNQPPYLSLPQLECNLVPHNRELILHNYFIPYNCKVISHNCDLSYNCKLILRRLLSHNCKLILSYCDVEFQN